MYNHFGWYFFYYSKRPKSEIEINLEMIIDCLGKGSILDNDNASQKLRITDLS